MGWFDSEKKKKAKPKPIFSLSKSKKPKKQEKLSFFKTLGKVDRTADMWITEQFGFNYVKKLVRKWKPDKTCKKESDYQKSLSKYLKEAVYQKSAREKKVLKRMHGDIVIGRTVIELKANFKTTGQLDRLYGQIKRYRKAKNIDSIVVVVCNVIDKELFSQLKREYMLNPLRLYGKEIVIMKK